MNNGRRAGVLHWIALALLVVSVCINYADRTSLAVAAKSIERDLHFPPDQLGILLGAFFWTYSLLQLVAGKVIDRWNVNWVYAAAFLLWSSATALSSLANSFGAILLLRFLLGAGESVAYPAYSKMIAIAFPEHFRGTANALIDAGSKMGPALGVLVGVKIIAWLSWRGMFATIGCISLFWLIPWSLIAPRLPVGDSSDTFSSGPSYRQLLSRRAVWGTALGLFGGNYTWYFFLTWLPYYFESARHYTANRLAVLGSLPFLTLAAASILSGLFADNLIRQGRDAGRVRQIFVSGGLMGCCGFMLAAVLVSQEALSNIFLVLCCISLGLFSSNNWALTQRLAGTDAAGRWTAIQNCFGNLPGILAPYVTGLVLSETHSFFTAFAIACAVLLLGAAGFWFVIGEPAPELWRAPSFPSDQRHPECRPM